MGLPNCFAVLARYNRVANERLYQVCSELSDVEYRKPRPGSFGSIHALLNHMLLSDRIWMGRFAGGGATTPPLDTILFETFSLLRSARGDEDARIEAFFGGLKEEFLEGGLSYVNSRGKVSQTPIDMAVAHFFNHQTHHRGQVHVMLSQAGVQPPTLDLHVLRNF